MQEILKPEDLSVPGPLLVDYYATWCGYCRSFFPVVARVAAGFPALATVKVNVEDWPEITERFHIRAVPTLVIMRDGREVCRKVGAITETRLKDWIQETLS